MTVTHPFVADNTPVVMAHQGNSVQAPSNTMAAFDMAIQNGCDIIETDMHWTKDGIVVLCHDDTVDGTSNGTGAIASMTHDELRQLDFGYRFSQDGGHTYPFRGQGLRIPTLKEVLEAFPTIRLNIDIKPKHPHNLRQLITDIYEMDAAHRVLVASFHHVVLEQFRAMNHRIATSASVLEVAKFCANTWISRRNAISYPFCALQVPPGAFGLRVVTERFVERAHRAGLKVHTWTIDDEDEMIELLGIGVDGIVTNRPDLAVAVRSRIIAEESA